jgi:unsaturated rhamnogalacturonyl hydrolase
MYELQHTKYRGIQHVTFMNDHHQQLWDNILMMTVLPLRKIGQLLGWAEYVNKAKKQFLIHIKYLFDPRTGLWFDGWTLEDGGHNFTSAQWARGNS